MTVSLYNQPLDSRSGQLVRCGWTGWKGWLVPANALKDFINEKHHLLDAPHDNPNRGDGFGWREYLSYEICAITRSNMEAVRRRLWGVMAGEQRVVNVSFAEATCMALGFNLDLDTTIPTLPGNMRNAVELIEVRSGITDELEIRRQARVALRLSALIIAYPHNQARLQDLAPYDCLRPY